MRIRMTADTPAHLTADRAARRITGVLLPFEVEGRPSMGPARIVVAAGAALTVDDGMVLNLEHDPARPIGRAVSTETTATGLLASFAVVDTTTGTDALVEAAEGLRTGLSIEAVDVQGTDTDGLFTITAARITEAALVRHAAFPQAFVTDVAATAATTQQEETVEDTTTLVAVDAATDQAVPEVQAAAPAPAPMPRVQVTQAPPTPGEFILATLSRDPSRMADMGRRIRAASPHTFVAEIPGLIPESIVGPVINLRAASAPLFNALGPNTAPAGKSFTIPYIDPNLDAATTGTEKSDVTDQLGVKEVNVTLDFVKRAVNLSAEAVAFSQPSVIDVAVSELADAIALGCEKNVGTKLEAVTGTGTAVEVAADGADAWAKLSAAQAAAYAATGRAGNVFACAPDVWAALAGFTNALGGTLIGGINQSLVGDWGTLFGMRVVVSPQMTAGKAFILNTAGVKTWTNASVNMRVDEPTILGYALGAGRSVGLSVASPKFITPVTFAAAP
jgi:hypothetical protein